MDKNFEIEFQEETINSMAASQLPINFLNFGEIENDDVKVYIKQDVYKALEKLSSSDTSKELGSILIGEYCEELGKTHVIISQFIEAKYTDASASTLTFTHDTWDYIHSEHEKLYPEQKIIGWQHTHPNYGIFLSNYDMFIQENFFNLPFQIAYVIDPIQNIRGFFQWKNGKIEKLKGYYIYDDIGKPIKIEQIKANKDKPASGKPSRAYTILITLLCVATVLLSYFMISISKKYEAQLEMQQDILVEMELQKSEIASQNAVINAQSNTIEILQEQLISGILDSTGQTTATKLIDLLENDELVLQNKDEVLSELNAFVEECNKTASDVRFFAYTVSSDDTLISICEAHNLDYAANINIILSINGISDTNQIYIGQTILLPTI